MFRFLRSARLTGLVAKVQPRPDAIQRPKSGTKLPLFQIDYATWHARLAGN
jgi:hypothetical protein